MVKVASRADLCYNKHNINIVAPAVLQTPKGWTNLIRRFVVDTIHPHVYFQQAFSFVDQLQKTCTGPCKRTLPATPEYFYRNKKGNDGLSWRCKDCKDAYRKALNKTYRDHSRSAPVNANCRRIEYTCDYCGKTAWEKLSQFKLKKRHFCCHQCYSLYRRDLMPIEEHARWKGIGDKQEYHRRYVKTHPERIAHLKAKRYAREKGAEGSHTLEEWQSLKEKFGNRCAICKKDKPLTKDHIIPLSRGGTDYIENIQPLCRNCNSRKWTKETYVYENPDETPELAPKEAL